MGPQVSGERPQTATERYSIAIITLDEPMFREMRRELSPSFRTTMASTESQIKILIDDPDIHGIVIDLESIGEGAADGVEVLRGDAAPARRPDHGGDHGFDRQRVAHHGQPGRR